MTRLVFVSASIVPLLILSLRFAVAAEVPPLPATPKKPATDVYHGIKIVDDYRWLENAAALAVRQWSKLGNRLYDIPGLVTPAPASSKQRSNFPASHALAGRHQRIYG